MTNKQYNAYIERRSERSPCFMNCIKAFLVGGLICLIGKCFATLYSSFGIDNETALLMGSLSLIIIAALLTGFGFFDKIAKFGGAGALVPLTGFSNAVTSPSIEARTEGYVTGVTSKMFTIAGPVIAFGTIASILYGILYYLYIIW